MIIDLFTAVPSRQDPRHRRHFAAKITEMRSYKAEYRKHGQIMEWPEDYDEANLALAYIASLWSLPVVA